jgi:hypothetical protein
MDALLSGALAYEDYSGDPLTLALTGGKIYAERTEHDYKLDPAEVRVVDFGSVASATIVFVYDVDNSVDVSVNGSVTPIPISSGGTLMLMLSAVTSLSITAGGVETRVSVVLLGD